MSSYQIIITIIIITIIVKCLLSIPLTCLELEEILVLHKSDI